MAGLINSAPKLAEILAGINPTGETEEAYFEHLGRFITSYARAEAAVHLVARKVSEMSDDRARIVFGGMRIEDIIERAKRLFELGLAPYNRLFKTGGSLTRESLSNLEGCLTQLAVIAEIRHEMVHRDVSFAESTFRVSNSLTAKSVSTAGLRIVTLKEMKAMRRDCEMIFLRLVSIVYPLEGWTPEDLAEYQAQPWLYKRARQALPKAKREKARKARKRQRRALLEKH